MEQLAETVSFLHRQGVVHANLKPSNVLLAADGIPRLTDFHLTGGLFQGSLPAESAGAVAAGYLAPELIEDPQSGARPQTDIYGLGVVLYELLTGRPPFAASSADAARELVRSSVPIPPSQVNPAVSPPVEAVCLKCLSKNPWRRYTRAYDLMRRLNRLREDPSGAALPTRQWRKRPAD